MLSERIADRYPRAAPVSEHTGAFLLISAAYALAIDH
jgi:hypothetical protein